MSAEGPVWRVCAYSECQVAFETVTHNQKYCSDDHCRLATNARIMEKYYERKARRAGAERKCKNPDCDVKLSRYNDSWICGKCERKAGEEARQRLLRMIE